MVDDIRICECIFIIFDNMSKQINNYVEGQTESGK
jgi:hypothetical protein